MTGTESCREIRQALGVYVLGAIDPAERALVDEHLAICLGCREELASLAGLPSLLRRIPLAEAERLAADDPGSDADAPSEMMLHSMLARASAVKRARRLRGLVAAAAVAVLALGAGAATTSLLNSPKGPAAPVGENWHTVTATYQSTGAHMIVKYAKMPWGTLMSVEVSGLKPGTPCEFQVTDYAGHRWTVGGWQYGPRGWMTWYPASTSVAEKNLRSFELTSGGKVLAVAPATE